MLLTLPCYVRLSEKKNIVKIQKSTKYKKFLIKVFSEKMNIFQFSF